MKLINKLKKVNKLLVIILIIDFILDIFPEYLNQTLHLKYLIIKIIRIFILLTCFAYINDENKKTLM